MATIKNKRVAAVASLAASMMLGGGIFASSATALQAGSDAARDAYHKANVASRNALADAQHLIRDQRSNDAGGVARDAYHTVTVASRNALAQADQQLR